MNTQDTGTPGMVAVTDLYVRCSYPSRHDALAASDTCQQSADTAVRDREGNLWWRCPEHRGQLALGPGEVVTHVPRRVTGGAQ